VPPSKPAAEATSAKTGPDVSSATVPGASGNGPSAPSAGTVPPAAATYPAQEVTLEGQQERFVFTNRGASLLRTQLREPKYLLRKGDPDSGIFLLPTQGAAEASFKVTFPGADFAAPAEDAWKVVSTSPTEVVFEADTPAITVVKRFKVDTTRYRLHLDVTVTNKSAGHHDVAMAVGVFGRQDPEKKGGGFFSGASSNIAAVLCHEPGRDVERHPIEKLAKESFERIGPVDWIAVDEKFFLLAAIPYPETPPHDRKCMAASRGTDLAEGQLSFASRSLAAGQSTAYAFAIFAGPKDIDDLKEVKPGGAEVQLEKAVDVTLAWLKLPGLLLALLKIFHRITGNWGVAIILLTIFIKLVTFYPTQRSLLSAKKMQRLGPKLQAIREKYANDRQRQSVETMNLYKAQGVSPFGGCLPSLIQMPIWIALYSTLSYAVELYREPFILHIHDLTSRDPYFVTPLLMGGVMAIQMRMSPASPDKQQQQVMSVMMPVMFTGFSLFLASGLAIYMMTSYLIGIFQQMYVNRLDKKAA
jgi:YidC/Oxa1 family membrane protein insertase